jgi:hypothetical protein
MNDEIAVITHHEAGHAVAALMTVDNKLDDQLTVTATLVNGRGTGKGDLLVSGDHPVQAAFIFYAGPWAEARVQWGKPVHTLDDTNVEGLSFREAVKAAFDDAPHFGGSSDGAYYARLAVADTRVPDSEPYWTGELERAWPVIRVLADALRSRLSDPTEVDIGSGIRHVMRNASMPTGEVGALVRPELESRAMWHYLK